MMCLQSFLFSTSARPRGRDRHSADLMPWSRTLALSLMAMLAFAGNSLLCRMALKNSHIDAATFTLARLASGAVVLWLIVRGRGGERLTTGNWGSALALTGYAGAFSFAYVSLSTGTGALLLFGAVQATMIGRGLWTGERLNTMQTTGLLCAIGGLVWLLLPGLSAPPWQGAALMLLAGVAWGVYSLRAKGSGDPLHATAGNFARAVPLAALLSVMCLATRTVDLPGLAYAVASGALASGLGYAAWYALLARIKVTTAATMQLSVPVIAAIGGVLMLGEPLTARVLVASMAILGGIGIVVAAGPVRLTRR